MYIFKFIYPFLSLIDLCMKLYILYLFRIMLLYLKYRYLVSLNYFLLILEMLLKKNILDWLKIELKKVKVRFLMPH